MDFEEKLKFLRSDYYKINIENEYRYLLTFLKFPVEVITMNEFIFYLESINDIAMRAANLLSFTESEFIKWQIDTYDEQYSIWNRETEQHFFDVKSKGQLSGTVNRERMENHIKSTHYKEIKEMLHKKRRWEWQISNLKSLTKQLENRQSVLQTLAGLLKGRKWIDGNETIELNKYKQIFLLNK